MIHRDRDRYYIDVIMDIDDVIINTGNSKDNRREVLKFSYGIYVREMFLNKGLYRVIAKNWVSIQRACS